MGNPDDTQFGGAERLETLEQILKAIQNINGQCLKVLKGDISPEARAIAAEIAEEVHSLDHLFRKLEQPNHRTAALVKLDNGSNKASKDKLAITKALVPFNSDNEEPQEVNKKIEILAEISNDKLKKMLKSHSKTLSARALAALAKMDEGISILNRILYNHSFESDCVEPKTAVESIINALLDIIKILIERVHEREIPSSKKYFLIFNKDPSAEWLNNELVELLDFLNTANKIAKKDSNGWLNRGEGLEAIVFFYRTAFMQEESALTIRTGRKVESILPLMSSIAREGALEQKENNNIWARIHEAKLQWSRINRVRILLQRIPFMQTWRSEKRSRKQRIKDIKSIIEIFSLTELKQMDGNTCERLIPFLQDNLFNIGLKELGAKHRQKFISEGDLTLSGLLNYNQRIASS